jgi:hypothetical protein
MFGPSLSSATTDQTAAVAIDALGRHGHAAAAGAERPKPIRDCAQQLSQWQ